VWKAVTFVEGFPVTTHFDVIIVGAGISGVCAAYHLQRSLPGKSFTILEARAAIGGTRDLFRYPGNMCCMGDRD
jgi:cation diffusion facilitator CzcD-associated flavoprotein CzcO